MPETRKKELSEFVKLMIEYYDNNLERLFKKPQNLRIAARGG